MAWRLANSLTTLRNQVNAAYPNRNKLSDGTIGDSAHDSSASDHTPNSAGVVTALDLTHSPETGFDAHALAEHLRVNRHPNMKYIISNGRIAGTHNGWQWGPNSGHYQHIHISVGVGPDGQSQQPYDDTTNWNIGGDMNKLTKEQVDLLMQIGQNRQATNEEKDWFSTQDATQVMKEILGSEGSRVFRTKAAQFDNVVSALNKEYADGDSQKLAAIQKIIEE